MREFVAAFMMCVLFAGCVGVSDGGFGIRGTVQSASGTPLQDCRLQLGVDAPDLVTFYTRKFTPPEFAEDFTVAPSKASYPLTISCAGHKPYKTTIGYGTTVGVGEWANLGTLVLEDAANGT